jgi:hypothetical protein
MRPPALLAALALLLATTAAAAPGGWTVGSDASAATLSFGTAEGDAPRHRFTCDARGTSFATLTRGRPRGVSADSFPTRLRFFTGRTEHDFAATGTVEPGTGRTTVMAPVSEPGLLDAILASNSFLFSSFFGRARGPAPGSEQVADFRQLCASMTVIARAG